MKIWTPYEICDGIEPSPHELVAKADYDALAARLAEAEALLRLAAENKRCFYCDSPIFVHTVERIEAFLTPDSASGKHVAKSMGDLLREHYPPDQPSGASELRRMAAGSGFMADCAKAVLERDTNTDQPEVTGK